MNTVSLSHHVETQRKKDGAALSLIFVKSADEKLLVNHLDCGKAVS
jgi:hypothetical protein